MSMLWHISDTHFSRHNEKNKEKRDRLLLLRERMQPEDWLIITGDVTDDGVPGQYENMVELLMPFKGRLILVPGNHDYGDAGWLYHERCWLAFRECTRELVCPATIFNNAFDIENTRMVVLDSCLRTGNPFDFAQGCIGGPAITYMIDEIEEAHSLGMQVCIALHHHVTYGGVYALKDAEVFLKATWGRADSVLFGHKHEEFIWTARAPIPTVFHSAMAFNDMGEDLDRIFLLNLKNGEWY